jgi:hypothetical protein
MLACHAADFPELRGRARPNLRQFRVERAGGMVQHALAACPARP